MALSKRTDGSIGNCCCGDCPAPNCVNCDFPAKCPPELLLLGDDSQLDFLRWDISADGWSSSEWPNTGCIDFSVDSSENDNFYIINYTSRADFESQLEISLAGDYGGTWTVSTTPFGAGFVVVSVSGIDVDLNPAVGTPQFIFATCEGVEMTFHNISGVQTHNCAYKLELSPLMNGGAPFFPNGACQYTYTEELTGICNLTLEASITMDTNNVIAVVQLKDGAVVESDATFTSGFLSNPYDCDTTIVLSLTANNNNGLILWDAFGANFIGV